MSLNVCFGDGEGVVYSDFNDMGSLSDRTLARYLMSPKIAPLVAVNGQGYPFLISGGSLALSGTGNRTATLAAGHFVQGEAIADDDDPGAVTGDFAGAILTHDAPTSGSVWRRDIIEIRIDAESTTQTETRDYQNPTTGVVSTQIYPKRRVRTVTAQIKKGSDQASEALADANEPAATAGFTKIFSVLVPATGSVDASKVKDYRVRVDRTVLRPAIQLGSTSGTVNDWAPTGMNDAVTVIRVPTPGTDLVITGIAGGYDGRLLVIESIGSDTSLIELLHDNAGSSAANRIYVPGGVQATLADGCSIILCYDATASRWRVIGGRYTVPQTIFLDPSSGQPVGSNFTWQGASTTTAAYWDISTTNQVITFPLPVRVGDRIRAVKFHLRDASGGTISARVVHSNSSTGSTAGDVMTSAGSGADQVITVTNLTGAAGAVGSSVSFWRAYFLTNSGSAMRIYGVELTIDRYLA